MYHMNHSAAAQRLEPQPSNGKWGSIDSARAALTCRAGRKHGDGFATIKQEVGGSEWGNYGVYPADSYTACNIDMDLCSV